MSQTPVPTAGIRFSIKDTTQPYINAIIGALIGLAVEYCFRPWRSAEPACRSSRETKTASFRAC